MQMIQWQCQPKAEALVLRLLEECCRRNPWVRAFESALLAGTSTRLLDWVDHCSVGYSEALLQELEEVGYVVEHAMPAYRVFSHPGAQLPTVVVRDRVDLTFGCAVVVDSIADFLMVHGMEGWIEGAPWSGFRRCCISTVDGAAFWAVERRGTRMHEPTYPSGNYLETFFKAMEKWQSRARHEEPLQLAGELVDLLGEDLAAWVVLECERRYWQVRNMAGQLQKGRQDRLGMGWANHDHHTFRSSREHFSKLVRLFEMLGFSCRERFYAGLEAGWGAQVMENPRCRGVLFLDVDLAPEEVDVDFSHHALKELPKLGTIGLWCALHGDSILQAGMHHLEAQFLFDHLKEDLAHAGVTMMDPFSDLPYLRQAFTSGERWKVEESRIEALLKKKLITDEQATRFRTYGAIGSHLENLQRKEGYKGFNPKNVSSIIKKTDPRL